jgi:hypothetical protein
MALKRVIQWATVQDQELSGPSGDLGYNIYSIPIVAGEAEFETTSLVSYYKVRAARCVAVTPALVECYVDTSKDILVFPNEKTRKTTR